MRLDGVLARCLQFADGFEHDAKLLVVFLLQFIQTSSEVSVRGEHCPKAHEALIIGTLTSCEPAS